MNTVINLRLATAALILIFISAGCNKSKIDKTAYEENPAGKEYDVVSNLEPKSESGTSSEFRQIGLENNLNPNSTDRMLIRTGSISIESDNFGNAESDILKLVKDNGGFVTNSSQQMNVSGKKNGSITARIPSDKFDTFLNSLTVAGKIMSQNISGQDVTAEYIDLEARQKTQRELETRLLDLLSSRTSNLKDVVEVEEKLSTVREKIESTEGRMNYLKNQSAFSTLTISVFEPALLQTSSGGGFIYEMKEAFKEGLEGFTGMISFIITLIVTAAPLIIFIAVIFIMVRKFIRSRKLKLQGT